MPLTVLQHGWFGTNNYGDERSAWSTRQMVWSLVPDAQFLVLGSEKDCLERHHPDVLDTAPRKDQAKVAEFAGKADVIIYGPGTVLGDEVVTGTLDLLASGKPFIVWGAGAWGALSPAGNGYKVVREAIGVSVRDMHAFDVALHAMGGGSERKIPFLIADPMVIDASRNELTKNHGVTVSWHLAAREPVEVQDRVLSTLADAMVAIGGKWYGIPASWPAGDPLGASTFDNDCWMHDRLFEKVGERVDFWRVRPADHHAVKVALSGVDLLITSRLHTGVPVSAGGRRVVFFGQEKCRWMAESIMLHGCYAGGYNDVSVSSIVKSAALDCKPRWPGSGTDVMFEFLTRAGVK